MGRCQNSVVIKAPAENVWARIRNFHEIASWAKGVIEQCEPVGPQKGDQVGAQRVLNATFHETLLALNDLDRSFVYRIDDAPGTPVAKGQVSHDVGSVRVQAVTADGSTFVEWTSTYDSPQDAVVGGFCNPIYQSLLKALQASFGLRRVPLRGIPSFELRGYCGSNQGQSRDSRGPRA